MKFDFTDIPNDELVTQIDKWIKSARDRKILKRRLIDGLTFDEIAAEFFLSRRQIIRITMKGEEKLFSKTK